MMHFRSLALGLALTIAATPALAQISAGGAPGGGGSPGANALGGAAAPQPKEDAPDLAPAALPGVSTDVPHVPMPGQHSSQGGDPTQALFAAVNKGDDTAAQNALSQGADLNAQDQFGETPLDLAIALNRTSIVFLLLQTRNELASQNGPTQPLGQPWLLNSPSPTVAKPGKGRHHALPHSVVPVATQPEEPRVSLPDTAGTPNPQAGFLGFGPSKN